MSGISQIQMSFSPTQDRILLKVDTADSSRFQFWLTRRYVKLLWPVLMRMLSDDARVTARQSDSARDAAAPFPPAQATRRTDYSGVSRGGPESYPLGTKPVLLSKIALKNTGRGQTLCVSPQNGEGIDLALSQTLLNSLCGLLRRTVARAGWGLSLDDNFPSVDSGRATAKRKLH